MQVTIDVADLPLFEAFLKNRTMIAALDAAGAFSTSHGKMTVSYHEGHIQTILIEERRYQHVVSIPGRNVPI